MSVSYGQMIATRQAIANLKGKMKRMSTNRIVDIPEPKVGSIIYNDGIPVRKVVIQKCCLGYVKREVEIDEEGNETDLL